jgi:hypothetical protein
MLIQEDSISEAVRCEGTWLVINGRTVWAISGRFLSILLSIEYLAATWDSHRGRAGGHFQNRPGDRKPFDVLVFLVPRWLPWLV